MRGRFRSKVPGREAILVYTLVKSYTGHVKESIVLEIVRVHSLHTFKDSDIYIKTIFFHVLWTTESVVDTSLFYPRSNTYQQDNSVWHVNLTLLHPFFGVISEDTLGHSLGFFRT